MKRKGGSLFHAHALIEPSAKGRGVHSEACCPINEAESFAIEVDHPGISSVADLLSARCPTNVPWLVATRVVDPVKTMEMGRPFSDGSQECREGRSPFRTYSDSACSIVPKRFVRRHMASLNHSYPRIIFRAARASVSGQEIAAQAAARSSATCSQRIRRNQYLSRALAYAQPADPAYTALAGPFHNAQATEVLSRKIDGVCAAAHTHDSRSLGHS